ELPMRVGAFTQAAPPHSGAANPASTHRLAAASPTQEAREIADGQRELRACAELRHRAGLAAFLFYSVLPAINADGCVNADCSSISTRAGSTPYRSAASANSRGGKASKNDRERMTGSRPGD